MSFTDDSVKAKFSSLAETQESIVTVAQWVMFHKRHADRTAQLWFQRLKESSPPKRLNLIYLANEVVQQTKIRKKDDFLIAFSPMIAEGTALAFKDATNDAQSKLRRVIEVWRQRSIWDPSVQADVEARVEELEKSQSRPATSKKPMLGGSLFSASSSSNVPTELAPLVPLQQALSKASISVGTTATKANTDYAVLNDGTQALPTPPVLAARLSALVKTLAAAEDAVAESLKTRRALIEGLERLMKTNSEELVKEEHQHQDISAKREAMTRRRYEVEDQIMRGLATNEPVERPEVESFTPPPDDQDSTTPPGMPPTIPNQVDGNIEMPPPGAEPTLPGVESFTPPHVPSLDEYPPMNPTIDAVPGTTTAPQISLDPRRRPQVKAEIVNAHPRPSDTSPMATTNGGSAYLAQAAKRRKTSDGYADFAEDGQDAMDGLDADVVGMLG